MRLISDPPPADVLRGVLDQSSDQILSAKALWQRLQPPLKSFGITRVADITGLDHLGFPVIQAVRPGARSNIVTQGKAATVEGAAVGAVLECREMAAGEDMTVFGKAPAALIPLWSELAPGATWPGADTPFIQAWDLLADKPGAVPSDLISTDFAQGADAEAAPILRVSIGLGAGSSLPAALMHGLLECIEGDARIRAETGGRMTRLAPSPKDPDYGPLLERVTQAGLRAAFWRMPCPVAGVCAIKASVMQAPGAAALPLPATGYAARCLPAHAMAAALAEAVQARLAVISGAREDITERFYNHGVALVDLQAEWARHAPCPAASPVPQSFAQPASLRSLAAQVGPVFGLPLYHDANLPLAITRLVAPQLIADPLRLEHAS